MTEQQNPGEASMWPSDEITSYPSGYVAPSQTALATATTTPKRDSNPAGKSTAGKRVASTNGPAIIAAPAASLGPHPSLGIELDEFAAANTELKDRLVDDLRRGEPLLDHPRVVRDGDRFLALEHFPRDVNRCGIPKLVEV